MKNKNYLSGLLFCGMIAGFSLSVSAETRQNDKVFISSDDSHIVYMGRISRTVPHMVRFTYPGVSIFANFEGTSLQMKVKPGSGAFMVEIDDELPYRINYSITCGYGVESENPKDPFTYDTENHFYTYAARTARALKAQHLVVARSGIGIYRNYAGPRSGSKDCMPAMYEQVLFTDSTELWNHALYTPDVVCVNLGTNDISLNDYDMDLLTDGYRRFMKKLRSIYPKAKLVLLSGSMTDSQALSDLKKAMDTVADEMHQNGDKEVYRFDMSPQTGSLGMGASYHPSMRQHQKMASELTVFLKKLMNW